MDIALIVLVTVLVAALTFVSGFGLGTLLLPIFILFFPVDIAVACTAIVHLANNIFKALLVGSRANWNVVWRFSLPAAALALLGAFLLQQASAVPSLLQYHWLGHLFTIT